MRKLSATIACLSFLATAGPAWAGGGNSSVDQYTEQIPTAGGGGGGSGGGSGTAIRARSRRRPRDAGEPGRDRAGRGQPRPVDRAEAGCQGARGEAPTARAPRSCPPMSAPRGPTSAVTARPATRSARRSAATPPGGMGVALPIILAASALAAIALSSWAAAAPAARLGRRSVGPRTTRLAATGHGRACGPDADARARRRRVGARTQDGLRRHPLREPARVRPRPVAEQGPRRRTRKVVRLNITWSSLAPTRAGGPARPERSRLPVRAPWTRRFEAPGTSG